MFEFHSFIRCEPNRLKMSDKKKLRFKVIKNSLIVLNSLILTGLSVLFLFVLTCLEHVVVQAYAHTPCTKQFGKLFSQYLPECPEDSPVPNHFDTLLISFF